MRTVTTRIRIALAVLGLGLTLSASPYLAEIWRGAVEAIAPGQWDAGAALGLHRIAQLRLVILDACRDNPFARNMKHSMASRSIGRGLARVVAAGSRDAGQVVETIRESIESARQRNDRALAARMLDPVAVLIGPHDPEAAYLLKLVCRRAPGFILVPPVSDGIDPARRAALEAEASVMPFDDAIALGLTLLDRHYPTA